MNVGLPGTGIGGLFYLISTFFILATEVYKTITRRSSKRRWKIITEQTWIAISMILVAIVVNFLLSTYIFKKHILTATHPQTTTQVIFYTFREHPILIPITLLFFILLLVQFLYLILSLRTWKNLKPQLADNIL